MPSGPAYIHATTQKELAKFRIMRIIGAIYPERCSGLGKA